MSSWSQATGTNDHRASGPRSLERLIAADVWAYDNTLSLQTAQEAAVLRAEVIRLHAPLAAQQAPKPGSAVFWLGVEGESALSGRNTPQTASEPPYAPQTGSDARCEPGGDQAPLETGARP